MKWGRKVGLSPFQHDGSQECEDLHHDGEAYPVLGVVACSRDGCRRRKGLQCRLRQGLRIYVRLGHGFEVHRLWELFESLEDGPGLFWVEAGLDEEKGQGFRGGVGQFLGPPLHEISATPILDALD